MAEKSIAEPQRKAVFLVLVEAQDQGMTVAASRKEIAERFGLNDRVLWLMVGIHSNLSSDLHGIDNRASVFGSKQAVFTPRPDVAMISP